MTFTVGKARWCAQFQTGSFVKNTGGRVVAKRAAAPGSCPCERADSTFQAIQNQIFERHGCTQVVCHGGPPFQGGLDLRPDVAYRNLVDAPSTVISGAKRVVRGVPRDSILWQELVKKATGEGDSRLNGMPSGALSALSESEIEAVRIWIHSGAPETGVVKEASGSTATLLDSCLPPATPINIRLSNQPHRSRLAAGRASSSHDERRTM